MLAMPFAAKTSREAILAAALELVRRQGLPALGMRPVAAELGLQAPSLYRHFAGEEALRQALAEEAARLLLGRLRRTRSFAGALAAYASFAQDESGLYLLLHAEGYAEPNVERRELWKFLLALVAPLTGDPDDTAAAVAVWSFLHGYCVLAGQGLFGDSGPRGGFARGVRLLERGLKEQNSAAQRSQ